MIRFIPLATYKKVHNSCERAALSGQNVIEFSWLKRKAVVWFDKQTYITHDYKETADDLCCVDFFDTSGRVWCSIYEDTFVMCCWRAIKYCLLNRK